MEFELAVSLFLVFIGLVVLFAQVKMFPLYAEVKKIRELLERFKDEGGKR